MTACNVGGSHITKEFAVLGESEIPPVIQISEYCPPIQQTASGRTEPPPPLSPHVIRVGTGSRAGHSDVPTQQMRVTTPGPAI